METAGRHPRRSAPDYTGFSGKQHEALFALASAASCSLEVEEVLRVGLDQVLAALRVEAGWIHLREESGELVIALSRGLPVEVVQEMKRLGPGQGLAGQVAEGGLPVVVEEPMQDQRVGTALKQMGFKRLLALPLKAQGEVLGVLGLAGQRVRRSQRLPFLEALGSTLGQAWWNALRYQRVRKMALADPLTGLPNARYIEEEIGKEMARCLRSKASFSLVMADVDSLKVVNDRFGHHVGDRLLRDIASLLRTALRASDTAARYGGDEFLILLPGANSNQAAQITQRISARITNYRLSGGGAAIPVSVSLGLASYPEHGSTVEELLHQADLAMYASKLVGGCRP